MDLALEFGVPLEQLSRTMNERELTKWFQYAGRKMLPMRRLEVYMAQLALTAARGALVGDLTIDQFIFRVRTFEEWEKTKNEPSDDDDEEPDIEAMRAALGWTPPPEE